MAASVRLGDRCRKSFSIGRSGRSERRSDAAGRVGQPRPEASGSVRRSATTAVRSEKRIARAGLDPVTRGRPGGPGRQGRGGALAPRGRCRADAAGGPYLQAGARCTTPVQHRRGRSGRCTTIDGSAGYDPTVPQDPPGARAALLPNGRGWQRRPAGAPGWAEFGTRARPDAGHGHDALHRGCCPRSARCGVERGGSSREAHGDRVAPAAYARRPDPLRSARGARGWVAARRSR